MIPDGNGGFEEVKKDLHPSWTVGYITNNEHYNHLSEGYDVMFSESGIRKTSEIGKLVYPNLRWYIKHRHNY